MGTSVDGWMMSGWVTRWVNRQTSCQGEIPSASRIIPPPSSGILSFLGTMCEHWRMYLGWTSAKLMHYCGPY